MSELREKTLSIEKKLLEQESAEFNFWLMTMLVMAVFIFGVTVVTNEHHYLHKVFLHDVPQAVSGFAKKLSS